MEYKKLVKIPTIVVEGNIPLPKAMIGIDIEVENHILEAAKEAFSTDGMIYVAMLNNSDRKEIKADSIYEYGVYSKLIQTTKINNSITRFFIDAIDKCKLLDLYEENGAYYSDIEVQIEESIELNKDKITIDAMRSELLDKFYKYLELQNSPQNRDFGNELDLDSLIANISTFVVEDKKKRRQLLKENSFDVRYQILLLHLQYEINKIEIRREIDSKVSAKMSKTQRQYILVETLNAIREELGESDPLNDYELYKKKVEELDIDNESKEKILTDVSRLKSLSPASQDSSVLKNYLDTIVDYPWNKYTNDNIDVKNAKKILDQDHYGLDKVKERILEFIALKHFKPDGHSPIICLVGPPGTGKTSIATSIAKALERKMVRISLGGVRDESEIRGHRRTYIGAMPGRIVKAVSQSGVSNPLILFDEIDKLGYDFRGDPSSALLEVLDYAQNSTFRDNYLEVPVDLSKVLFITTANSLNTIPEPLLDRMEVIQVNSYTENEKFHIAKEHLYKKQLDEYGLTKKEVSISDSAIKMMINAYIKEAGVRGLERKIGELLRRAAKVLIENPKKKSIRITCKNLSEYIGNQKYNDDNSNKKDAIGIVNGLAWTYFGGRTLQIEVNCFDGKGNLSLTGQMGDVMKESAFIARSYLRSVADKYKIDKEFFDKKDIHLHIPEGAVPKDGPSAGITMTSAILSAILEKPVRANLCMTGEITLRGRVLPIGGLKEKLLAAKNAKITNVLVPKQNKNDVEEIDDEIKEGLNIKFVSDMSEVIKELFVEEKNEN